LDRTGWGKRLSLLLVAANVALLATGLALEQWQRQARQLPGYNADKIRIVRTPRASGKPLEEETQAPEPAAPVCFTIRVDDQAVYPALRQGLEQAGINASMYHLGVDNRLGWWVFWPPESDPVEQVRLLKRFEDIGIRDLAPIRRGPMSGAISLGMFAGEADARSRSESLQQKGLDRVDYGPRPGTESLTLSLTAEGNKRLDVLRAALGGQVKLEGEPCPGQP
jgi:hypothetical protein